MNKEQEELLGDVYKNYMRWAEEHSKTHLYEPYSQEEFINKIKTDVEFSERWGLKIEERELSLEERYKLVGIFGKEKLPGQPYYTDEQQHSLLDELAPTKQITITYNNKTIENYE
jgi:hypothetical protein